MEIKQRQLNILHKELIYLKNQDLLFSSSSDSDDDYLVLDKNEVIALKSKLESDASILNTNLTT